MRTEIERSGRIIGAGRPSRIAAGVLAGALAAVLGAGGLRAQEHPGTRERPAREAEAGSAAPAEARPPIPHAGHRYVRTEDHPDDGAFEVIVGPVRLPTGMPHYRVPTQVVSIPDLGWIHGFSWRITDADGNRLPDDLLHHVNLIDPDRRQLFTPISRRIVAAGRETRAASLPPVMGIPTHPDMRLVVASMFANATGTSYDRAYLHVTLEYVPRGDRLVRPVNVYPFYVDVMGPLGVKDFPVPPGRTERSWEGRPAIDARILGLGTHMHDFASRVRLEDVTTGETLWSARPWADARGRVFAAPTAQFWLEGGLPLRSDHVYRVAIVYDNPLDHPTPLGGMGLAAGLFAPVGGEDVPTVDRDDPTYRQDLWNTVTAPLRTLHSNMSSHETRQAGPAPADMFSGRYPDAGEEGPVAGPEPGAAPMDMEHGGHGGDAHQHGSR